MDHDQPRGSARGLPMLRGYRVLDISQFVAGPTCARLLAEAGADVVKIELAPAGDRSRLQGFKPRGADHAGSSQSTYYFQHNHSKRSLALDFKHPEGRALIRQLVARSDVVVENFTPGVMARAGLGYEDLRALNPAIIMCSISLAGQTGPLSGKPGYDYIAQAYSGVTSLVGEPDRSPAQLPLALGDVSTGVAAAMAIGFALLHRERTGEGQHIDATLLDTYFHMHEANVPKVAIRGASFVPQRAGSSHPDGGPIGNFACGGQFLNITVLHHQWPQLVRALGRPDLLADPRFATAHARRTNDGVLYGIIAAWLAGFADRAEAIEALERERIPCAPVLTLNEAVAHPHFIARGTVREVSDPQLGDFKIPGAPARFSAWPDNPELRADMLGGHNEAVLAELGLAPERIAELYRDGVLVRDPLLAPRSEIQAKEAAARRPGQG